MKVKNLLIITLFSLFISFVTRAEIKPVISDEYFSNVVSLFKKSGHGDFVHFLGTELPVIHSQILLDSNDSFLTKLWGRSHNFDSGAKEIILDYSLIENIQSKFGIKNDNKIVHAGIMHTYGYLFSTLNTPYGFKRKRYLNGTLDNAFGLENILNPAPKSGTLFSNLSYFCGKIAFSNAEFVMSLDKLKNIDPKIKNFDFKNLKIVSLHEEVTSDKINFPYVLSTYFVKFQSPDLEDKNTHLLIYKVTNQKTNKEELITAFPINQQSYLKSIDSNLLGEDRPILVRYNAFIGENNATRLSGKRWISGL